MHDPKINAEPRTREALEAQYGQVWDTTQLDDEFVVTAIVAPHVVVRRKADDVVGSLEFQNDPRFYFNFVPDKGAE